MAELTKEELVAPVKQPELKGSTREVLGQALGTNLDFATKRSDLRKAIGKTEKDILTGEQEQKEMLATGESETAKKYAEAEKGAMQGYQEKLEAEPLPAFIPTKDTAQDLAGLFSLVAVMGMFAGKQDGQRAMSAMNGMLEGYQKGRKDLYEKERKEFDANFKSMLKKHEEFRKEMEDAIKLAATDKEAGLQAAKLAAVKSGSKIINAKIDKGDFVGAFEDIKDAQKGEQHLRDSYVKIVQHEDDMKARALDRAAMREQTKELARIKAGSGVSDVNSYIQKFTGSAVNKKDAPEIMTAANAIGDAYAIKQIVAEHPEWVGRTGQIKNFFNRTIESINAGEPPPADQGQPELIFAKRYAEYLVNYERALAGNARGFTVAFQKRFNTLLEQNQFNATGMDNLMNEQIRTITSKAAEKSPTVNRQNLTQMAYDLKTRAEDEDAVKGMATSFGQEPSVSAAPKGKAMPSGDKMKAYADAHFSGDENKAKEYLKTQGYQ